MTNQPTYPPLQVGSVKLPHVVAINNHVWQLAGVVHPRARGEDYVAWCQKVMKRYDIESGTIDGALTYEMACLLWASLSNTEQQKCVRLGELYEQARAQGFSPEDLNREMELAR